MPSDIRVTGLTWRPVGRARPVLTDIALAIPAGERVLLAGPSGSGKSTLLRALAGVLQANESGEYAGNVTIGGADPRSSAGDVGSPRSGAGGDQPTSGGAGGDQPTSGDAGGVGLLVQDPADALVAHRVGRDVAFGLENGSVPRAAIWPRVTAALESVRFPYGSKHRVDALSGGEMQRLALAGVVVMRPGLLLLDEPTAMLDPVTAAAVRGAIVAAADQVGATTVVVAHHLEDWVGRADRLLVLGADGQLAQDGPCAQVLRREAVSLAVQGVWVPGRTDPLPLRVDPSLVQPYARPGSPMWLRAVAVGVRRAEQWALREVDAQVRGGAVLAIQGASGAGKSTLIAVLAGLLRPSVGQVDVSAGLARGLDRPPYRWRSRDLAERMGWVPQRAEHGFVRHTVHDDVCATGLALGRDPQWVRGRADALLEALGLTSLAGANPYRLSGGEQRRLTLATALAHGPDLLILDEPTVGQDRVTWAAVVGVIEAARAAGVGVALATHDRRSVDAVATRQLVLHHGRTRAEEPGTARSA